MEKASWGFDPEDGCHKEMVTPSSGVTCYKAALEAIDKAEQHVYALCEGGKRWTMRVPVDEDKDSDCIIMAALTQARKIIEAL